jgi:hypothetical protein
MAMTQTTTPRTRVRKVTREEGDARVKAIVAALDQMGMSVDEARQYRDEYRLTERQWRLVRELDTLEWLLLG